MFTFCVLAPLVHENMVAVLIFCFNLNRDKPLLQYLFINTVALNATGNVHSH